VHSVVVRVKIETKNHVEQAVRRVYDTIRYDNFSDNIYFYDICEMTSN